MDSIKIHTEDVPKEKTQFRITDKLDTEYREPTTNPPETTDSVKAEEKVFDASETHTRLMQKIRDTVEPYRNQLGKLSRIDYMSVASTLRNNTALSHAINLIPYVFTDWANQTVLEGDNRDVVISIAQGISNLITALPDSDFFGDLTNIDQKYSALNTLSRGDANKGAALTIFDSQLGIRAKRLKTR